MAWRVFCKHCNLPFDIEKDPAPCKDPTKHELTLTCPSCGESNTYTALDVTRATSAKAE